MVGKEVRIELTNNQFLVGKCELSDEGAILISNYVPGNDYEKMITVPWTSILYVTWRRVK